MKKIVTNDDIVELQHILIVAKNVNNRMENESKISRVYCILTGREN